LGCGPKKTKAVAGSRSVDVGGDLSQTVGKSRSFKMGAKVEMNASGDLVLKASKIEAN